VSKGLTRAKAITTATRQRRSAWPKCWTDRNDGFTVTKTG